VTINGRRVEENLPGSAQFVAKELYWGEFTKTVYMPNGVEVEASEAQAEEKHGMLLLKLPKIDKNKETRLRIKSV
jgi:HSP20 family molecular chaperone IbpA